MKSLIPQIEFNESSLLKAGFEVFDIKKLYQRAANGELAYIAQAHRVNFHNLIIYTGNPGKHFVDFHAFPVERNSLVLVNKGQIHAFDLTNKPEGIIVVFTDQYMSEVSAAIDGRLFAPTQFMTSYQPSLVMSDKQAISITRIFSLISAEYQQDFANIPYMKILFAAVLAKVSELKPEIYHQQMSAPQINSFERFIRHLHGSYTQVRDANDYAAKVGTSYKTLNKLCKLATNLTAKQLIDAHVILEAKRRLSIDNTQIQQIASDLGFEEVTNFVKYFKKHTLVTPSQFKKSLT
ncbi:helix-turn-helix domain-containing protein [Marinomonas pollencensis]|uniref:AraC family transcriptional regulator n=1 Tax=Marinomonas pollencensis TaxID=491954 RepID=A0A3E0DKI4_9GAMM|nr:helix-turn-helix domain-containing protein [Marinomonas pollencensis]REG83230.1 AraC family transcriptional regulator [Marinomonas pollencensis]